MEPVHLTRESILRQLEKVLGSETFSGAGRSTALLTFLIEQTLDDRADRLKEYTLGAEALGRGEAFDPRTDPIVRAEASRLRARLERYYGAEGRADAVLIVLPKGSYVPRFEVRPAPGDESRAAEEVRDTRRASVRTTRLAWFAIGAVAAGVVLGSARWLRDRALPAETRPLEFEVELARGDLALGSDFGSDVTVSPDGSRIVFVVRDRASQLHLVTRGVGESSARDLPGTEGARLPFSSPNGRWVGFWADGKIKKTAVDGGSPVALADAADFGGASWGQDDHLIAAVGHAVVRVAASPGVPSVIVDLRRHAVYPRWPDVLPGGRHVLITTLGSQGPTATNIEALSLADGTRTVLVKGGTFARYRSGYLVYVNQGTLFAIPFDVDRLSTRGTAVPVLSNISYASTFGFAQLDISRTGTLVYRRSPAQAPRVASWIDRSGETEPFLVQPGSYLSPRLSPDGRRLALAMTDGGAMITSVFEPAFGRTTRLAPVPGSLSGIWTGDGRFLVIASRKGLHWMRADEPSRLTPLTGATAIQVPWSFSPDGTRLAYYEHDPSSAFDLWTIPITESDGRLSAGEAELFLRTSSFETYPSFSPDGRWVAYGSGEYGGWEIYVRSFPRSDAPGVRVSEGGGRIPRWLTGTRELLYRTDDHRLMVVPYTVKNGAFVPGKPREWTSERLADTGVINNFDVDSDGKRVLALLPVDRDEDRRRRNQVTIVLNFNEEVRRRVSQAGNQREKE
jgi:serine/threonine-protein kinase